MSMFYNRAGVGRIDDAYTSKVRTKAVFKAHDPGSLDCNALKPNPRRKKLHERRTVREFSVPLQRIQDQTQFRLAKHAVKGYNPHHFNKTYLRGDPEIEQKERRTVPLTEAYREKLFREYNHVPGQEPQKVDSTILDEVRKLFHNERNISNKNMLEDLLSKLNRGDMESLNQRQQVIYQRLLKKFANTFLTTPAGRAQKKDEEVAVKEEESASDESEPDESEPEEEEDFKNVKREEGKYPDGIPQPTGVPEELEVNSDAEVELSLQRRLSGMFNDLPSPKSPDKWVGELDLPSLEDLSDDDDDRKHMFDREQGLIEAIYKSNMSDTNKNKEIRKELNEVMNRKGIKLSLHSGARAGTASQQLEALVNELPRFIDTSRRAAPRLGPPLRVPVSSSTSLSSSSFQTPIRQPSSGLGPHPPSAGFMDLLKDYDLMSPNAQKVREDFENFRNRRGAI